MRVAVGILLVGLVRLVLAPPGDKLVWLEMSLTPPGGRFVELANHFPPGGWLWVGLLVSVAAGVVRRRPGPPGGVTRGVGIFFLGANASFFLCPPRWAPGEELLRVGGVALVHPLEGSARGEVVREAYRAATLELLGRVPPHLREDLASWHDRLWALRGAALEEDPDPRFQSASFARAAGVRLALDGLEGFTRYTLEAPSLFGGLTWAVLTLGVGTASVVAFLLAARVDPRVGEVLRWLNTSVHPRQLELATEVERLSSGQASLSQRVAWLLEQIVPPGGPPWGGG